MYAVQEYCFICLLLQALEEEETMTPEQLAIKNVGKQVLRHALFTLCFIVCCIISFYSNFFFYPPFENLIAFLKARDFPSVCFMLF